MIHARVSIVSVALAAGMSLPMSAGAQDKSTYYTVTHPKEFEINWKQFYDQADELTAATRRELPHSLDLAYGADPKQKLDVYQPVRSGNGAPVFIFLHGGGMREGDRAHYGYVARPFAKQGIITVVASYRLTPTFHYPDQPEDARSVVAWVFHNIRSHGGDPRQIYLGGHSAGANLTALVSLKRDWLATRSLPGDVLKGCAPISGTYDVRASPTGSEYVPDPARREEASPLLNVVNLPQRCVVAAGTAEGRTPGSGPTGRYAAAAHALGDTIRAKGGSVEVVTLEGLEHHETVLALGDEQSPLFQAIVRMIRPRAAGQSEPRE